MAVEAQYPSNSFSPDLRTRIQSNNLSDELQMLQGRDNIIYNHHQFADGVSLNHGGISPLIFNNNNDAVFSNPQSELTCIYASGSKKRIREEPSLNNPIAFEYPNLIRSDLSHSCLINSAPTSTSGRPSSSSIAKGLVSHLYQYHSLEIDSLIRLQNETLRLGLEQAQKRHRRALISVLEQQLVKKLNEKETELQNASRRNAELEEKVRLMSAESQIWFNVAKNNEAIVSTLRTSLEQVLLQNTVKEGHGESAEAVFPADDAQSCCFKGDELERTNGSVKTSTTAEDRRRKCKVCGDKDLSVLVLPCRHLCLCKDCES